MKRIHRHWLEKFQLQFVTGAALAMVYFGCWQVLRGPDPGGAVSLMANGGSSELAVFAVLFLALAAVCGVLTIAGRGECAMIATLVGAGGLALRSGQIRVLLWNYMSEPSKLFYKLMAELVVLGILLVLADCLAKLVRSAAIRVRPAWGWKDPLADLPTDELSKLGRSADQQDMCTLSVVRRLVMPGKASDRGGKVAKLNTDLAIRALQGAAIAVVIAVACLFTFMRSADRGQILFALFASFFLSVLIAHHFYPTPYAALGWLLPLVTGVLAYALAAGSVMGEPPQGWIEVRAYARALPIDWLTAGCGGAMLGYWVSSRVHESKYLEEDQQQEGS